MSTDGIVAFLEARWDEQEAGARAATPGPWWKDDQTAPHYGDFGWYVAGCPAGETEDSERGRADAIFIARNDPASVLADIKAKRRLVADLLAESHEVVEDCWYTCAAATEERDGDSTCRDVPDDARCDCGRDVRVLRRLTILVQPFHDHPDFDPAWRLEETA